MKIPKTNEYYDYQTINGEYKNPSDWIFRPKKFSGVVENRTIQLLI